MGTLQELQRAEEERRMQERQNKKTGLYNAVKMGNNYRGDIGQMGKQLSQYGQQYNNQGLQNIGNNMYKWSGEKYMDNALSKVGDKVGKLWGDKVDAGVNQLSNIAEKGANPLKTGTDLMNSNLDKLSGELSSQAGQTGGSAISDAIGSEVAGNAGQAGTSAIADAAATEVGTGAAQAAGTGLAEGAGTAATTAGTTAGTAAGATGATAAGAGGAAAGGTAAAAGAASVVPIVGWVAAAAMLAKSAFDAHKKKQQAAAMQADALADKEMEQDQQQQFQEQAASEQQMQKFTDMINKQLGQGGTDNPYAQAIEQMQQAQQPNVDLDQWEGGDESNIDETSAMPQQTTGQQVANDALNTGTNIAADLFTKYQGGEGGNTIADAIQQQTQSKEPRLGTFAPVQTQEAQIPRADYQTGELLNKSQLPDMKQQIYNQLATGETGVPNYNADKVAEQPQAEQKKQSVFSDFKRGFDENATHAMGDNRNTIPESEKNWKTRLGEGLGTTSRILQNPAVQGLLAGGIDYALTGNARSALNTGASYLQNRGKTNAYRDLLQQGDNPVYYNPGLFGQITSNDYRQIMQQPLQNAQVEKYKQETLDKQLKNEATQLMNQMTPEVRDLAAKMVTTPRKQAELLKQFEAQYGALDETQRNALTRFVTNPDYAGAVNTSNKNTNTFVKNNTDKEKFEWTKGRVENNLPTQISRMDVMHPDGGGKGGGYSGSRSSGGGSSYKPENPTNNPENYVKVLNDDGTADYITRKNVTPKDLEKIKKKNKNIKQRIENERKWQSPVNPLGIKGL